MAWIHPPSILILRLSQPRTLLYCFFFFIPKSIASCSIAQRHTTSELPKTSVGTECHFAFHFLLQGPLQAAKQHWSSWLSKKTFACPSPLELAVGVNDVPPTRPGDRRSFKTTPHRVCTCVCLCVFGNCFCCAVMLGLPKTILSLYALSCTVLFVVHHLRRSQDWDWPVALVSDCFAFAFVVVVALVYDMNVAWAFCSWEDSAPAISVGRCGYRLESSFRQSLFARLGKFLPRAQGWSPLLMPIVSCSTISHWVLGFANAIGCCM